MVPKFGCFNQENRTPSDIQKLQRKNNRTRAQFKLREKPKAFYSNKLL